MLKIEGMSSAMKTIELIDASGRVVNSWKVNGELMQLDLSKYSAGNYNLKISRLDNLLNEVANFVTSLILLNLFFWINF